MARAGSRGDNQKDAQGEPPLVGIFLQPLLEYGDLTVTIAADLMIRDSERRCAAALLRLAGCRYAGPQDVTPVEVPLTQNELAGAANLSRNSVGTMLQRLATRGFVEVGYGTMIAPGHVAERERRERATFS
jgi:CRP-like cAMP-binding protein